jgi:hypothetical protein
VNKDDARKLVDKFAKAAFEAGMHYDSAMKEKWQQIAKDIGDKIVHCLSEQSDAKR